MDLRRPWDGRGVLAWGVAWAIALALSWVRFRSAMASADRPDLEDFFLPAARAVRAGGSPYEVVGYLYSPFVALLLAPVADASWAVGGWTVLLLALALASCWMGAQASAHRSGRVGRAAVFAVAAVSLLSSWALTMELWQGQVHLFVLAAVTLAMLATTRGLRGVAGTALAVAGMVKTWPAVLLVWLLRRPLHLRRSEWVGAAGVAVLTVALVVAVGGPAALGTMASETRRGSSQPLVAYSAWGAGTVLFTESGLSDPVLVSPALRVIVTGLVLAWVLALLVVTLRRPGDAVVALLNVAFCVVLLLPVSHYVYLLVPLPALWWWSARALREPRRWQVWVTALVLGLWWFVALRRIPPVGPDALTTPGSFVLVLGSTLAAATLSVWTAARLPDPDSDPASITPARRRRVRA